MFLCECTGLKKFFGGQNLADDESCSYCLVVQNIKGMEISSFLICPRLLESQASTRRFTPPTSDIHMQRLFLIAPVSVVPNLGSAGQPCLLWREPTWSQSPLRNQTPAAASYSSPSYDPIRSHTHLSCILKGNGLSCTSQEAYCSTGPTFLFASKGALTNFPRRGVEGKTGTAGDLRPAKWKRSDWAMIPCGCFFLTRPQRAVSKNIDSPFSAYANLQDWGKGDFRNKIILWSPIRGHLSPSRRVSGGQIWD